MKDENSCIECRNKDGIIKRFQDYTNEKDKQIAELNRSNMFLGKEIADKDKLAQERLKEIVFLRDRVDNRDREWVGKIETIGEGEYDGTLAFNLSLNEWKKVKSEMGVNK